MQEIIKTKNVEECISICKDKSIFNENQIREEYPYRSTVVKLLDYKPFKNKVMLKTLRENNIIKGAGGPRIFDFMEKEQFDTIYKLGMEE